MDSRAVSGAVRQVVWPRLRDAGFTEFSRRAAWRYWSDGSDLVLLRSFSSYVADGVGCTTYSFAVVVGVCFDYVPKRVASPVRARDRKTPESWCDAKRTLEKALTQPWFQPYRSAERVLGPRPLVERADVWFVLPDGSNLEECLEDAADVICGVGLPWVVRYHDPKKVVTDPMAIDSDGWGAPSSPRARWIACNALIRLGRLGEAESLLNGLMTEDAAASWPIDAAVAALAAATESPDPR